MAAYRRPISFEHYSSQRYPNGNFPNREDSHEEEHAYPESDEAKQSVAQDPIPPGDGCDASLAWWFSDEARNPKPGPKKPRRELTLADLPQACATVLTR